MSIKVLRDRSRHRAQVLAASFAGLCLGTVPVGAQSPLLSPVPLATTPPQSAGTATPAGSASAPAIVLPAVPSVPAAAVTLPAVEAAQPAPSAGPAATASPSAPAAVPATPVAQVKKKRVAPPAPPRETALSSDPEPTLTPETFFATAKASERYAAIADAGGWPQIPGPVGPGASGKAVSTLRLRLAIEGDLGKSEGADPADVTAGMFSAKWGPDLTAAIKRFQTRHGLRDTGVVSGGTLKALNVAARTRFTELASSAQRLAGRQISFADRYVVVNIPSASVEAVAGGRVVHRYVAVVGDPDHASPEVDAKVVAVNLNPTWTVPTSIIKNEIIPKMQKDPGYLSRAKIRILDGAGNTVNASSIDWTSQHATNYILRQDSGSSNSLGNIRINMPNKFAVYMHDTPSKRFFGGDYRFLSHGCVRVQGVFDLASWLLEGTSAPGGAWDKSVIENRIAAGAHEEVKLVKPVPVAWVYLTGWADAAGVVQFRDDVYGIDTVGTGAQAQADPDPIATIAKTQ